MVGTIVAAVVAVLALVGVILLAIGLGRVRRGLGGRLAQASADLDGCMAARREAEQAAAEARDRAAEATERARASEERVALAEGRERGVGRALWALEGRRRAREWEGVAGPVGASAPQPGPGELADLTNALRLELDMIREEVGTPGTLAAPAPPPRAGGSTGSPANGPSGSPALLAGLLVTLVGEDWMELGGVPTGVPGPDPGLVDALSDAARAVGSELQVDPVKAGSIRATWRLPLGAPTTAVPVGPGAPLRT